MSVRAEERPETTTPGRESPASLVPPAVEPARRTAVHPLSFGQEQLWYLHHLDPGSTAYNMPAALRLRGPLDPALLEESLNRVRRRHQALRTVLRVEDGEPVQRVLPFRPVSLPLLEASGERAPGGRTGLLDLLRTEARTPFDLAAGPPFRWLLVRLDEEDHVFLHLAHHAVFDGWSMQIFFRELGACYGALARGEEPELPELRIQYADFARWQRSWLRGPVLERLLEYWTGHLEGGGGVMDLPLDRERPPVRSDRGEVVRYRLSREQTGRVRALCKEAGATPFMLVVALLQTLLHRYSGEADVRVGVPMAGRERRELRGAIGAFINTVVFRGDLSGDPAFREHLDRTRDRAMEALRYQALPFGKLVEALRPERSTSHDPLIHAFLRYWKWDEKGALDLPGVSVDALPVDPGGTLADLDLFVVENPETIELSLAYATDLFEEATARRILGHYLALLEGAVADPDRPLSRLPLLTPKERRRLSAWTRTGAAPEAPATLHQMVEEAAERWPDGAAVEGGGRLVSRKALEMRANRLARRLRDEGVGPGSRVGVLLPRTPDLPAALLGVLKAGGAYLPLDPAFPPARIAFMVEDAGAGLAVTTRELAALLPDGVPRLVLDDEAGEPGGRSPDPLPRPGENGVRPPVPDDPAYVIYTSGSTGRPKGVEVPHRAVASFLRAMAREPGLGPDDRLLAVTTLTFDISVLELFLPLVTGGAVVLADDEEAADGRALQALLEEDGITVMQATPATWRLLVDAGWEGDPPIRVLCGGEAMTPGIARELLDRSPEVWNLYGPTEATVWCTRHRVTDPRGPIPIGRPVEGTTAYVLDGAGNPVPERVPGELWIGGEQVALGYVDRPELTAERFRPDPFSERPGGRMYRTGDRVRWRPGGTLEFLGRRDDQVKVRGFRIEPGEVEAGLGRMDEVRRAVAGVHEDGAGERRLVAWVAYHPGHELMPGEVRRRLRKELPAYMVPSLVVDVPDFPRTPSGKVDRRSLPEPLGEGAAASGESRPPSTPVERTLAGIWEEVLGVERIGLEDNFFDLGGHSLLAMRVLIRVEEETGRRLEPRDMILGSLEQLARAVEEGTGP